VWRGADYVGETLESVLKQRGVDLRVSISIDGADESSAAACRPFLADRRVTLVVQSARLGWVANSSAVLAAAAASAADYACVQPHDDLLDDDYLATLVDTAEARPGAAVVYSDIQCFGSYSAVLEQPTVAGPAMQRQLELMQQYFAAVSYRGLIRASALPSILPMIGNPYDDYYADVVWIARQALVGDLVRVPQTLYRKRYHPGNTHMRWFAWSAQRQMAAWLMHCVDMLAVALQAARTRRDRARLHRAARLRFVTYAPLIAKNTVEGAEQGAWFRAAVARRADIRPAPLTLREAGSRAKESLALSLSRSRR
jgi:glycosyltransferase involved in cell wall biosynthesis